MTDLKSAVARAVYQDDDDRALAPLSTRAERIKHHRSRLQAIGYHKGAEGVANYKAKFPEAATLRVRIQSTAGESKPKGYDDFLCRLVGAWFISDTALNESNRATVGRLNIALAPRRFDPDRHFGAGLSDGRLKQIAAVFVQHGAHLDIRTIKTMSAIRKAVKIAKASKSQGKPFGEVGRIIDGHLITGDQSFNVMQHHGHDAIKITIDGKRIWLRLDVAEAFISLARLRAAVSTANEKQLSVGSIPTREMVPDPEIGQIYPLSGGGSSCSSGKMVPMQEAPALSPAELIPNDPLTLSEQLATRRSALLCAAIAKTALPFEPSHCAATVDDPDADPLALT